MTFVYPKEETQILTELKWQLKILVKKFDAKKAEE
jgi:hypothetical protein